VAKITLKALFSRARAATPLPPADLALSREAADVELCSAEAAFDAAQAGYRAGLVDADDDTLKHLAQAQADAGLRRDRARALVDRFDAQLEAIRTAEVQVAEAKRHAELEAIVAKADTTVAALRDAFDRIVPAMIGGGHELLTLARVAEQARSEAIRALDAAGDDRVPASVESFRVVSGRPEKTLSVETVEMWVDERGDPVGRQSQITAGSDGSGWMKLPNATHGRRFTHRRPFERTTYLPTIQAQRAVSFASVLPELIAAIGRLEMPPEPQEASRQPLTRLRPLGAAVDVREAIAEARRAEATRRLVEDRLPAIELVEPSRAERAAMGKHADA
jgi:hypothetical protein